MNSTLFAKALGVGVERAALFSYADACRLNDGNEFTQVVRDDASDDWVQVEIMAIQPLTDHIGECVELCILVNDGRKEMKAYFYSRQEIPDAM